MKLLSSMGLMVEPKLQKRVEKILRYKQNITRKEKGKITYINKPTRDFGFGWHLHYDSFSKIFM